MSGRRGHDEAVIDERIESSRTLVHSIAWQIRRKLPAHVDLDDLIGHGQLGLVEAAHRFDESRDVKFTTFAFWRIRGAILDAISRQEWFNQADFDSGVFEQDLIDSEAEGASVERHAGPAARRERTPADVASESEMRGKLREALGHLPPESAALVRMVYVEGHTLAEVARRMGIDRSWAVRLHQRVIEHLGQTLRAKGKDPPRA